MLTDPHILKILWEISGFLREVYENSALPGYYTACSGSSLPTFRDNLSAPSSSVRNSSCPLIILTFEDGTNRFSGNVGKKLPQYAA